MLIRIMLKTISLVVLFVINCNGQSDRKAFVENWESIFKNYFMGRCLNLWDYCDCPWKDVVCTDTEMALDTQAMLEIDSMAKVTYNLIVAEVRFIAMDTRDVSAISFQEIGLWPTNGCVIKHCLNTYDSPDVQKLARGYAKRLYKSGAFPFSQFDWPD